MFSWCGEKERKLSDPWYYLIGQNPLVELPWKLRALCRRPLGSERRRHAIA